jgi:hypothetical protein
MSLVTYSGLINKLSGKIGSSVFSQSCGGQVLRRSPSSIFRQSPDRQNVNARIIQLSRMWSTLTQAQRDEWIYYASFISFYSKRSGTYKLGGYQCFMKCNSNLLLIGASPNSSPIWDFSSHTLSIISFVANTSDAVIGYTPEIDLDTHYPLCHLSDCLSAGLSSGKGKLYFITPNSFDEEEAHFTTHYSSAFGHMPYIGKKIFADCTIIDINSGVSGNTLSTSTIIQS